MPLFDYVCRSCGHQFEKIVSRVEDEVKCPKCGADAEQQISKPAPMQWGSKGRGF